MRDDRPMACVLFSRLNRLQHFPPNSITMRTMSRAMNSVNCGCRQPNWPSICCRWFFANSIRRRPHVLAKWMWHSMGSLRWMWMSRLMEWLWWWTRALSADFGSFDSNRRRRFSFFVPWNRPLWIQTAHSISVSNASDTHPIGPASWLRSAPAIERGNACTLATGCDVEWAILCRLHRQCIASIPDANWSDVPFRRNRAPGLPCSRARRVCPWIGWPNSTEAVWSGQLISDAHCCAFVLPIGGWDFDRCSTIRTMTRLNLCVCTDPVE